MNEDNYTLPIGLTTAAVGAVPEDKILDDHFTLRSNIVTDSPEAIRDRCLALCKHTLALGMTNLPYEYAKAAAHWQSLVDRQRAA